MLALPSVEVHHPPLDAPRTAHRSLVRATMHLRSSLFLIVVAAVGGGCRSGGAAAPSAPPPVPPAQAEKAGEEIAVCVVKDGALASLPAAYDPATGDTTVDGRPFSQVHPDTVGYAGGRQWYLAEVPIRFERYHYVKYGIPRVLGMHEITPVAQYEGVPIFAEAGRTGPWEVLYLPERPGCMFQPYQTYIDVVGVRGE